MPALSLRIDLDGGRRVGPGKIELLEKIAALGSISAAGREMRMSYRRAWLLVDELNTIMGTPVVTSQTGGKRGGGAALTECGSELVARYRSIEKAAARAAAPYLAGLGAAARD